MKIASNKINVLGTEYKIIFHNSKEDNEIFKRYDGWCDSSVKEIHILAEWEGDKANRDYVNSKILRHEILHAFMYEAGQDVESYWGLNEELIDFLAIQFPKINKIFEEAKIL